jgi:hypothetical protein
MGLNFGTAGNPQKGPFTERRVRRGACDANANRPRASSTGGGMGTVGSLTSEPHVEVDNEADLWLGSVSGLPDPETSRECLRFTDVVGIFCGEEAPSVATI